MNKTMRLQAESQKRPPSHYSSTRRLQLSEFKLPRPQCPKSQMWPSKLVCRDVFNWNVELLLSIQPTSQLTPVNPTVTYKVEETYQNFIGHRSSLPISKEFATGLYIDLVDSIPHLCFLFLWDSL